MAAEKSLAIVLKLVPFSESSYIATLYTEDFGKITGMAKGAKRAKSAFSSALDLLSVCRIVFLRKSGDSLDLLTEAKLLQRFIDSPDLNELGKARLAIRIAEVEHHMIDGADEFLQLMTVCGLALDCFREARKSD